MSGGAPGAPGGAGLVLILAAHGSRDPSAQATVLLLARQMSRAVDGVQVRPAFVRAAEPGLAQTLATAAARPGRRRLVVAPLLLAGGHHLSADIAPAAAAAGARVAAPLGPDPRLADALADRLTRAGVPARTPVVLAAAGSRDPDVLADTSRQAAMLAERWQAPVREAFAAAAAPSVPDAAAELAKASGGPVAVASYLLAPGFFHARLRRSGAAWVSDPLGAHPAVVDVALDRFRAVLAGNAQSWVPEREA